MLKSMTNIYRHKYRRFLFYGMTAVFAVFFTGFLVIAIFAASHARLISSEPSLLVTDRNGRFLCELEDRDGKYGFWPLEKSHSRVEAAIIAIEDRRFREHPGVDPRAVLRAIYQNFQSGRRISGASTIAMQVARIQRPGSRTYLRKIEEAMTAVFLTMRYGRNDVLAHYLKIAPFGGRICGIKYAARRYFNKPVEDLDWAETAFLAALPQAPGKMNPFDPHGKTKAVRRGKRILALLLAQNEISQAEYTAAGKRIEKLQISSRAKRPVSTLHAILRLNEILVESETLQTGRPIAATLDLDLQEEVSRMISASVDRWKNKGAGNAAAIVLDHSSGEILAWVGSTGYFDETRAGAIDYARVPRSTGSTLKPFIYALALDHGLITGADILDDTGRGNVRNADEKYYGPMLPRAALGNSRNVPSVRLLSKLGIDKGFELFHELGLHDGTQDPNIYGTGMAIGSLPTCLEKLAGAYTAIVGDGMLSDLKWYEGQPVSRPRRIFSVDTARQVTLFLSDPMARLPAFPRMGPAEFPFPAAVKTGTSSKFRDAWAVMYSLRYMVAVWVGHPENRPMNQLGGYGSAAVQAREIILRLHDDQTGGLEDLDFPLPRKYTPADICILTGKLASPACDRVFTEWFRPGTEPVDFCSAHIRLVIDIRDSMPASSGTPPEYRKERTFVSLAPRYAAWAAASGLQRPPSFSLPFKPEPVKIRITSPKQGIRILRDPETPGKMATISLQVVVKPRGEQIVWYVDGIPYKIVEYPYSARWPVSPGEHRFQARIPYSDFASDDVMIYIR